MTPECRRHTDELQAVERGGTASVSDDLAFHLDSCPACRLRFDRGALPLDAAAFESLTAKDRRAVLRALVGARSGWWGWWGAAAAVVVLAIAVTWLVASLSRDSASPRGSSTPSLAEALVEDHIRYLGDPDRADRAGRSELDDRLAGHVDFPVSLPRTSIAELTGARRCFLLGRRVVLAFYQAGGVPVSYFLLPPGGTALPETTCADAPTMRCAAVRGYAIVTWERSGLIHGVVAAEPEVAAGFARQVISTADSDQPNEKHSISIPKGASQP